MYTLVFKQQIDNIIVFDVLKKPFFGRQRLVGNVFCMKDEKNNYKATCTFYMASWPDWTSVRGDGQLKSYYLEKKAIWICERLLFNEDCYKDYK